MEGRRWSRAGRGPPSCDLEVGVFRVWPSCLARVLTLIRGGGGGRRRRVGASEGSSCHAKAAVNYDSG